MAFFFTAGALCVFAGHLKNKYKNWRVTSCAYVLLLAFMILLASTFHIAPKNNLFLTKIFIPDYCAVLSEKPDKAVIDLPIGFTSNLYQLQIHHNKSIAVNSGWYFNLLEDNSFTQYMFLWNNIASEGIVSDLQPFAYLKGINGEDVMYGEKVKIIRKGKFGKWNALSQVNLNNDNLIKDYKRLTDINFNYIIVHKANCLWIDNMRGEEIFKALCGIAEQHFGKPSYTDEDVAIFEMKADIILPDDIIEKAEDNLK
ncbi:MAG: hypothetical protein K6G50_06890 [bacterium]|nr:hypothetical protein [bacterium]